MNHGVVEGFAEVNETRLHYEVAGSGDALIFVHGFGSDLRSWAPQFEFFLQYFRVIRYDVRGFGKSAMPGTKPYGHYEDLKALLEHFGVESAHVVGRSRGGSIAVNFALRYPGSLKKLVLVSCSPGPVQAPRIHLSTKESRYETLIETARRDGVPAARELYRRSPIFTALREREELVGSLDTILDDYSGWHWLNDDPHVELEPPAPQRLIEIQAPTLVVIGGRDAELFHTYGDILARDIPNLRRLDVETAGHMVGLEAPETLNQAVLEFLRD